MKKKLTLLTIVYLVISIIFIPFFRVVSFVLFILFILVGLSLIWILILNKLYKHTNHWKNQFLFQKKFISNSEYRNNISRNFDVVNLGSNPALYGLFYEKVRGQNWATGSQGLPMDFEVLKYFHSYIKNDGYVLIPIMPFTAISQYIKNKPDYWDLSYYTKFASILDGAQVDALPNGKKIQRNLRYPIIYNLRLVRYILHDVEPNKSCDIAEQQMTSLELEQDARKWINGWKKEFDAKNMKEFFNDRYRPYKKESLDILKQMIDFCLERNLNPVLITIPISSFLSAHFSAEFRQRMLVDFIKSVNVRNIKVLDYMFDDSLSDASLYMDSFLLNLRGRKIFTTKVMTDLGL